MKRPPVRAKASIARPAKEFAEVEQQTFRRLAWRRMKAAARGKKK